MRKLALSLALFLLASLGFAAPRPSLPPFLDEKALVTLLADPEAKVLLLDVRTYEEFAAGYIPGAELLPYDQIATKFKEADKDRPIVVYCRSGNRSATARKSLLALGYRNVSDFGAYTKWTGRLLRK